MPNIIPLQPERAAEARRVIYTVAHDLFHADEALEETIARESITWPLQDVLTFQQTYCESGGCFLVLEAGGCIIGTGALRRFPSDEPNVGEVKRLWLLPQYHSQGLGYRMMQYLLDEARARGYTTVRLQTSPAYQPRAYDFYHRLGFYDIPRYGNDPDDVGLELKLEK